MNLDHAKARRESMRWTIMLTLNNARPVSTHESLVLTTIQGVYPDATAHEVRRELDYLNDRLLLVLKKEPSGIWYADLTSLGVDVAEYTVECHPGIARPTKYWAG
ncbi:hypothetical protein [Gilvimarinus agarilyticus]|uniref:hypothetical protein n=1 Tax=Gilvimarinus agarilyticus TaxID=679259 RepID=UPI00059EF13E|nr:hypothetical protein [Gilvimarinus agarilyticus]